jgi:glycosyltransferase involved in cell wall biosynthesis
LGFPQDARIAAFVGHFIERKGPQRALEAVERLDNAQIMLLGAGPTRLGSPRICFEGVVEHDVLPEYLSAADVFVLPTLQEGCCNAILEAMACGLPIVSSVGDFNDDILNDEVSIRVDPLDVDAISAAIKTVLDDESLRMRMSAKCLVHSEKFSVDNRARGILQWISGPVDRHTARVRAELRPT